MGKTDILYAIIYLVIAGVVVAFWNGGTGDMW